MIPFRVSISLFTSILYHKGYKFRVVFTTAFGTIGLDTKQQENLFKKMEKAKTKWLEFIDISFLNEEMKTGYKNLILDRFNRIYPAN
jgi:hypothetical protein